MDIPQAIVIASGFFATSLTIIKIFGISRQGQVQSQDLLKEMNAKIVEVKQLVTDIHTAIREELHRYDIRLTRLELESGVVKDELKRWATQE